MSPKNLYGEDTVNLPAIADVADVNVVAASGAAVSLDTTGYGCHDVTLTAPCTFTFASPYTSGHLCSFLLILRQNAIGGNAVVWPLSVDWDSGVPPVIATTPNIRNDFQFYTTDGGVTWAGMVIGKDIK